MTSELVEQAKLAQEDLLRLRVRDWSYSLFRHCAIEKKEKMPQIRPIFPWRDWFRENGKTARALNLFAGAITRRRASMMTTAAGAMMISLEAMKLPAERASVGVA